MPSSTSHGPLLPKQFRASDVSLGLNGPKYVAFYQITARPLARENHNPTRRSYRAPVRLGRRITVAAAASRSRRTIGDAHLGARPSVVIDTIGVGRALGFHGSAEVVF